MGLLWGYAPSTFQIHLSLSLSLFLSHAKSTVQILLSIKTQDWYQTQLLSGTQSLRPLKHPLSSLFHHRFSLSLSLNLHVSMSMDLDYCYEFWLFCFGFCVDWLIVEELCIYCTHLSLLNSRAQLHNSRGNTHNLSLFYQVILSHVDLEVYGVWGFSDLMRRSRLRSLMIWRFIWGWGWDIFWLLIWGSNMYGCVYLH